MRNYKALFSLLGLALAFAWADPGGALAAPGEQPYTVVPQSAEAAKQAERQKAQPLNNAPVWREVRSGDPGITQIRGVETGVLVQSAGNTWRQMRNGPITSYGGVLLGVVVLAISAFFALRGPIKVHEAPTGRRIQRFGSWDRAVHWAVAISFVILALSGLVLLFGKHVLLPVLGYTLFSWLANVSKMLHNFVGPFFLLSAVAMIITYLKDNLWKAYDMQWLAKAGGLFSGKEVPSGKFNAGEKIWFWIGLVGLTIVVGVTGLILNFPNFDQGREAMQQANVIHSIAALIYTALALGHIYMGTIGVQGAYDTMRGDGLCDETWAKEHHGIWYEEVKSGKRGEATSGAQAGAGLQHT